MSKQLEKKYRVASFDGMRAKIKELGAQPTLDIRSTHYYAHLDTDDTLKMINYPDRVELHRVSTKNGMHSIDEIITFDSIETGFAWFRDHGYDSLDVLKMHDEEYSYLDGGFALYTVQGDIFSVILGYEADKIADMEKLFGLTDAEEIHKPYNKYIAQLGKLQTIHID
jgi:hypothetical protein